MGHFVYKYVCSGEIIYIGKNDTVLSNRLKAHGRVGDNIDKQFWDEINKSEIYYLEFDNPIIADEVETILINKYTPKCNKAKIIKDFDKYRIHYDEREYEWKIFKKIHKEEDKNIVVQSCVYNDLINKYNELKTELMNIKEEKNIISLKASVYDDYINLLNCLKNVPDELDMFKENPLKYKADYKIKEVNKNNELIERIKSIYLAVIEKHGFSYFIKEKNI